MYRVNIRISYGYLKDVNSSTHIITICLCYLFKIFSLLYAHNKASEDIFSSHLLPPIRYFLFLVWKYIFQKKKIVYFCYLIQTLDTCIWFKNGEETRVPT